MRTRVPQLLPCLALLLMVGSIGAQERIETLKKEVAETQSQGISAQQRINDLDDASRRLWDEYRQVGRSADELEAYTVQLERLIESQAGEKADIQRQLDEIEQTRRNIVPLMVRMADVLEASVNVDLPFLPEERGRRVENVRAVLDRSDVGLPEKYRRLIEAYLVEAEYGQSIEAYSGPLDGDEGGRNVEFLRVGRLGLYYLSFDDKESGRWDRAARGWVELPDAYNRDIARGIAIARKQVPPELMRLPVSAPESPP